MNGKIKLSLAELNKILSYKFDLTVEVRTIYWDENNSKDRKWVNTWEKNIDLIELDIISDNG